MWPLSGGGGVLPACALEWINKMNKFEIKMPNVTNPCFFRLPSPFCVLVGFGSYRTKDVLVSGFKNSAESNPKKKKKKFSAVSTWRNCLPKVRSPAELTQSSQVTSVSHAPIISLYMLLPSAPPSSPFTSPSRFSGGFFSPSFSSFQPSPSSSCLPQFVHGRQNSADEPPCLWILSALSGRSYSKLLSGTR